MGRQPAATAIDLFSGAGGFSLGLLQAGLVVRLGSDLWHPAAETYRRNHAEHAFLEADARDLTSADVLARLPNGTRPQVVVGGPPCQGFSSAGARKEHDHRNTLVGVYAELAASLCPDVVVFENVEGFLTAGEGRFVHDLLEPLIDAGYQVSVRKVNVANYGVPQLRKRVIAIAALGRQPADLVPTHRAFGAPGVCRVGRALPPTLTVDNALDGLPVPSIEASGILAHHGAIAVGKADQERIHALAPGQTMRDLPEHLWHDSYRRRAYRRVMDGTPTERRGGAPAGIRRLRGDEPSKAITSAASREFIHPHEDRPLTLRECARIQTFPDDFELIGTRNDVATMIGNAVPPSFARAVGLAIMETLDRPVVMSSVGKLVRFDATTSDGMSPALAAVVEAVELRYGLRRAAAEAAQVTISRRARGSETAACPPMRPAPSRPRR